MYRNKSIFLIVFTLFALTACSSGNGQTTGKGPIIEKEHAINKNFSQVTVGHAWKVELIKSDQNRIIIYAQENIQPLVNYEVSNGELKISYKKSTSIKNPPKDQRIKLYYKELDEIKVKEAAHVFSEDTLDQRSLTLNASSAGSLDLHLKTGKTKIDATSASSIKLSGTSIQTEIKATSASSVKAEDLKTKVAKVNTSSAATATINVVDELNAKASSGSSIRYTGSPKATEIQNDLSSSIKQK